MKVQKSGRGHCEEEAGDASEPLPAAAISVGSIGNLCSQAPARAGTMSTNQGWAGR